MVLEDRQRRVVAIGVKVANTVRAEDFCGLWVLRDKLGEDFVAGIVLSPEMQRCRWAKTAGDASKRIVGDGSLVMLGSGPTRSLGFRK